MSVKHKIQIKFRQRLRRRQRKLKLLKQGLNPNDFFYGKYYLKPKSFLSATSSLSDLSSEEKK